MGKWKDRRERNREELKLYDDEYKRLLLRRQSLEPGTQAYREAQEEIANHVQIENASREMKRRITRDGKAGILRTLAWGVGVGTLGYITYRCEAGGHLLSGGKTDVFKGITGTIGKMFPR